jgi:hypothetical protein
MHREIRNIAVYTAVLTWFVLAAVSGFYRCSPGVCAGRALLGAFVMYWIVLLAGRLAVRILVEAMLDKKYGPPGPEDRET